jgi:hypothetical protein
MPRTFAGPDLERDLSDVTVANYKSTLEVLRKHGITDITNVDRVLTAIGVKLKGGAPTKASTQVSKLSAIVREVCKMRQTSQDVAEIHKLDTVIQKYQSAFETIKKDADKRELESSLKDPYVEWSKLKNLYQSAGLTPTETAMLALFDLFPPRRRQDYAKMMVVSVTPRKALKNMNWFVVNEAFTKARFVFRHYKTRHVYESQDFNVPDELFRVLKSAGVVEVGKYLIKLGKGSPLTPDGFGQAFTKLNAKLLDGVKATVNTYRHSFITDFLLKNPPYSEKVKVAEMMAHSVGQQSQYDRREGWGVPLCPCPVKRTTRRNAAELTV